MQFSPATVCGCAGGKEQLPWVGPLLPPATVPKMERWLSGSAEPPHYTDPISLRAAGSWGGFFCFSRYFPCSLTDNQRGILVLLTNNSTRNRICVHTVLTALSLSVCMCWLRYLLLVVVKWECHLSALLSLPPLFSPSLPLSLSPSRSLLCDHVWKGELSASCTCHHA